METIRDQDHTEVTISRLREIVLAHINDEDFDVDTFSRTSGLDRPALQHLIKKESGNSVTQFIREVRLKKAVELLANGDHTAAEVAYMVGFNSPTYFSKCFKDAFGFTPGDTQYHPEEINQILDLYAKRKETSFKMRKWKVFGMISVVITLFIFAFWFWNAHESRQPEKTPDPELTSEAAASNTNSLAVLPLMNWTGDEQYDFICYGMTDAIISRLVPINTLDRVAPMRAVMPFKDSVLILRSVAENLQVANILHGSVQKAGDQFKFSFQFINAHTGEHLWSRDFVIAWKPEAAFEMQESIASDVIRALGINEKPFIMTNPPTTSVEAYNYFLQGAHQANIFTRHSWENAVNLFGKALEKDPEYLRATLYLAYIWRGAGMIWSYISQEEAWDNSRKYLRRALEIDPGNETAKYFLLEGYFYFELDAKPSDKEAPVLSTEELINYNADFATKVGAFHMAREDYLEFIKREPFDGVTYAHLAINHFFLEQEIQAKELLEAHYELYKDDLNFLREASKAYYFLDDMDNLEKAVDYFFYRFEERPYIMRWLKAIVSKYNGDSEELNRQLDSIQAGFQIKDSGSPGWFLALYYAKQKDYEMALEWLERSYQNRETEMTWLKQEPDLRPLSNHPRYRALLDSMNFPELPPRKE